MYLLLKHFELNRKLTNLIKTDLPIQTKKQLLILLTKEFHKYLLFWKFLLVVVLFAFFKIISCFIDLSNLNEPFKWVYLFLILKEFILILKLILLSIYNKKSYISFSMFFKIFYKSVDKEFKNIKNYSSFKWIYQKISFFGILPFLFSIEINKTIVDYFLRNQLSNPIFES